MSKKFTGITSGGQEIPVYDKAALHDAYSAGNNISINDNVIAVTGRKSLAVQSPLSAEVSGNSIIISLDESALDVSSKLDTSAFAEVSGSFLTSGDLDGYATQEWVGEQGYLTEVPESAVSGFATHEEVESATSGLQPSGDYATNSAVAAALSGKADTTALNGYLTKASGDNFYVKNTPYEVTAGPTDGSGGNPVFRANPGGLFVGGAGYKVLSATNGSFNAGDPDRGLILSADYNRFVYSGASNATISADNGGFVFNGQNHSFDVKRDGINFSGASAILDVTSGINFSSNSTAFGSAALTTAQYNTIVQMQSPKFEARNISGAGFSIEGSAAKGYDHNGNVVWDTSNPPAPNNLVGYGDTKASSGGLTGNIILTYWGKANTANPLTSAPYIILDSNGLSATYGNTASAPYSVITPNGIIARYSGNSAAASVDFNGITFTHGSATWSLIGSVQKREIECDSATSAITAIAGSAIGGGGDVPEGVMATSGLEYNSQGYINGYEGSAIATIDQERQWFTHDDTLVHLSNSAQYALGVNLSGISADLARMMGVDETVLWSGELSVGQTAALAENYSAFRKLEFKYRTWSTIDNGQMKYEEFGTEYGQWQTLAGWMKNNLKAVFIGAYSATDNNHITLYSATFNNITATNSWSDAVANYRLFEIRGIGRKN